MTEITVEITAEVKGPGSPTLTNPEYKAAKKDAKGGKQRRIVLVNHRTNHIKSGNFSEHFDWTRKLIPVWHGTVKKPLDNGVQFVQNLMLGGQPNELTNSGRNTEPNQSEGREGERVLGVAEAANTTNDIISVGE